MSQNRSDLGSACPPIVAHDPASRRLLEQAEHLAGFDTTTVLIQGETGTGKEVLARFIHSRSPRREGPFVVLDCATIPSSLLEAGLFGYEKGAYTGASQRHSGLLEQAEGGTLLLDEVAGLSPQAQASLLRFIETGEVHRIGNGSPEVVDVRILAASNRDLDRMVDRGDLRIDLYYRMSVLTLSVPPLRERPDDIEPLLLSYLEYWAKHHDMVVPSLEEEALRMLYKHPWKGNVRELRNAAEWFCIRCREGNVTPEKVITYFYGPEADRILNRAARCGGRLGDPGFVIRLLGAWSEFEGHVTRTAGLLGLPKSTVSEYVRRLQLGP